MSDSTRPDYSYQEVKKFLANNKLPRNPSEEICYISEDAIRKERICLATKIKQINNPYSKEDREGLERLAFERMRQLAIGEIQGEHILSKECWCNPRIEVVK